MSKFKTAVIIPAYKRPEYTKECLNTLFWAQDYDNVIFYFIDDGGNKEIFEQFKRPQDILIVHDHPRGLRNSIIEFFTWVKENDIEFISKVDNDCLVPKNWLNDLIKILESTKVDILSPNVSETQAAYKYGRDDTYGLGYRPSSFVGGLWTMRRKLIDSIFFEEADTTGIRGAFSLLHQIIRMNEPQPRIGWTEKVCFEDLGHWGGTHEKHIKSEEHLAYSAEVGRPVGWTVEAGQ